MRHGRTVEELIAEYREGAVVAGSSDPKRNKKGVDKLHACYKKLRETEQGRAGIIGLITNENPHVRGWAAAHSLQWAPEIARSALESLRDSDGPSSFAAEWTLKSFDRGTLSFDY
jgi:hypothetical protein